MKCFKKLLPVFLVLVLCGSMVTPAFAAVTFNDLNNALSNNFTEGKEIGNGRYGYGDQNQDTQKYEIEAWDQDDTRYVEVNTDVAYDPDEDGYGTNIYIGHNQKVDLDLNGNTITGTDANSVVCIEEGEPADASPVPSDAPGELTIHDGTITGGGGSTEQQRSLSGVDDSTKQGGGIYVGKNATLTLDNTQVTENAADQGGGVYADAGANVELTNGSKVSGNEGGDVYLDYGDTGYRAPSGEDDGGGVNTPRGGSWADGSGNTYSGPVKADGEGLNLTWTPSNTSGSGSGEFADTLDEVEIADPDIPMGQGPVSCAEFIHKMWVLDGEPEPLDDRGLPEGVDEDHEYAPAIAWAVSAEIVSLDGFDAEALLTVALAREYLNNFAAYADMVMPELTTLTGKDDDPVMNSDDVLDEFFGKKDSE